MSFGAITVIVFTDIGAVSLGHRIAHCTNPYSPYKLDGYILKQYTQEELRKLGLPTDHYSKHKKKTL